MDTLNLPETHLDWMLAEAHFGTVAGAEGMIYFTCGDEIKQLIKWILHFKLLLHSNINCSFTQTTFRPDLNPERLMNEPFRWKILPHISSWHRSLPVWCFGEIRVLRNVSRLCHLWACAVDPWVDPAHRLLSASEQLGRKKMTSVEKNAVRSVSPPLTSSMVEKDCS